MNRKMAYRVFATVLMIVLFSALGAYLKIRYEIFNNSWVHIPLFSALSWVGLRIIWDGEI